uniref:Transposase n=1 Tax=Meloidogyne hapla TaxID=6305 RepID=A0A1I8BX31_MELHA
MKFSLSFGVKRCRRNVEDWFRRVWEVGYVGPSLPKKQCEESVDTTRQHLMREWNVMQWLANPYLNSERERPYIERYGDVVDQWRQSQIEAKQRKMPNKPKIFKVYDGSLEKRRANIGNMLHSHRTVEDQMKDLIRLTRWD